MIPGIRAVIMTEAPIHTAVLQQRLREAWDIGRIAVRVRPLVERHLILLRPLQQFLHGRLPCRDHLRITLRLRYKISNVPSPRTQLCPPIRMTRTRAIRLTIRPEMMQTLTCLVSVVRSDQIRRYRLVASGEIAATADIHSLLLPPSTSNPIRFQSFSSVTGAAVQQVYLGPQANQPSPVPDPTPDHASAAAPVSPAAPASKSRRRTGSSPSFLWTSRPTPGPRTRATSPSSSLACRVPSPRFRLRPACRLA
jgi:hypothetical protein